MIKVFIFNGFLFPIKRFLAYCTIFIPSFYRNNGTYSLNWIFHAQDDPINNLLINEKFLPPSIGKDSVSISDLVAYYYPKKKNRSGVNDIKLGATFLLKGTPYWALDGTGEAIYGQFLPEGARVRF